MWSLDLHTQQELVILKDNISQCRRLPTQITVCLKEKLIWHRDQLIVMWSSAPPVRTVALSLLWFWKESDDGRSCFFSVACQLELGDWNIFSGKPVLPTELWNEWNTAGAFGRIRSSEMYLILLIGVITKTSLLMLLKDPYLRKWRHLEASCCC